MKFALSNIAVATGLVLVASSALAVPTGVNKPLTNYAGTDTTNIYLAGSSAVDLALTKFFAKACDAGTLDTYRSDAGVKTYYLWTCESASNGFGLASGHTKIAIHKNTNSSSDGVNTLKNSAPPIAFLKTTDFAACNVVATPIPASAGLGAYTQSTCGTTAGNAGAGTDSQIADFGFADSEPTQYNAVAAADLTAAYPFSIIFGVVVSTNVRDALQLQQFGVSGNDTDASKVPSLSSAQLNAIFTGSVTSWSAAAGATGTFANPIYVVRRGDGSGSNRAFNTAFVGEFCTPGLPAMVPGVAITTPTSECVAATTNSARRKTAASSDDMVACVTKFNSGSLGAIGYVSTDYQPTAADGYRFVKVDGYLPTQLNVVDGKYKVWSEEAMTYNSNRNLPGDLLGFFGRFQSASADQAYLAAVAGGLTQPLGGWTGGLLGALPGSNLSGWGLAAGSNQLLPRTDASILANPANTLSRGSSTGYNLCSQPQPSSGYKAQ